MMGSHGKQENQEYPAGWGLTHHCRECRGRWGWEVSIPSHSGVHQVVLAAPCGSWCTDGDAASQELHAHGNGMAPAQHLAVSTSLLCAKKWDNTFAGENSSLMKLTAVLPRLPPPPPCLQQPLPTCAPWQCACSVPAGAPPGGQHWFCGCSAHAITLVHLTRAAAGFAAHWV